MTKVISKIFSLQYFTLAHSWHVRSLGVFIGAKGLGRCRLLPRVNTWPPVVPVGSIKLRYLWLSRKLFPNWFRCKFVRMWVDDTRWMQKLSILYFIRMVSCWTQAEKSKIVDKNYYIKTLCSQQCFVASRDTHIPYLNKFN